MKFRAPYDYDVKLASDETAILPGGPSLTVQSQAEDADINVMMKRFGVTGKFPENPRVPVYDDFSQIRDFRSALEALVAAEDAFMEYPADLRARFENDPQVFLQFCSDPANIPEMRKLGFFKQEVTNVGFTEPRGGGNAPAGSAASPQSGGGAPQGDAGAGVAHGPAK